jgi:hypothetical protein
VASWLGLSQAVHQGVTTALGAIYAVSALAYCEYEPYQRISYLLPRAKIFPSLRQFSH